MMVGLGERLGVRIDHSLNLLSSAGFTLMLVMLYAMGKTIFERRLTGLFAVILTLFNGSLSFLAFFRTHPISLSTPIDILTNTTFPSFGPWDGSVISAFWTMNIFTNQRHLGLSYGLIFILIYIGIRTQPRIYTQFSLPVIATVLTVYAPSVVRALLIAIIISVLFFLNQAALAIVGIVFTWLFLLVPKARGTIIIAAIATLPAYILWTQITASSGLPAWSPGYLMVHPISVYTFIEYWWMNLGLHMICIPIGMIIAPRPAKKLFIVPLILLFTIANLYRLSPDMINNHKSFNFILIIGSLFSATVLTKLVDSLHRTKADNTIDPAREISSNTTHPKPAYHFQDTPIYRVLTGLLGIGLFGILTLSGIIDLPPIFNDHVYTVDDRSNPDVKAFVSLTKPGDIILNSTFFYNPASLAGRPIFFGYSYFTWSYGYEQTARERVFLDLWRTSDKMAACNTLVSNNIRFIALSDYAESSILPHTVFWNTEFIRIYRNDTSGLSIFSVEKSCKYHE